MKIVYIAHPISGDIDNNLKKILAIIRDININYTDVIPFAHYVVDCMALNDNIKSEREKGISNDIFFLKSGIINELWLFGNTISKGMRHEIDLCNLLNIPVIPMTIETELML